MSLRLRDPYDLMYANSVKEEEKEEVVEKVGEEEEEEETLYCTNTQN